MELTKERLQEIESVLSAGALGYSVERGEVLEMARQLLAGMEQEPVAWRWRQNESKPWHLTVHSDCAGEVQPLYAAPQLPQPAVPECYQRLLRHAYGMTMGHDWNKGTMAGHHREKLCKAVEDCRAAMLQGGKS